MLDHKKIKKMEKKGCKTIYFPFPLFGKQEKQTGGNFSESKKIECKGCLFFKNGHCENIYS